MDPAVYFNDYIFEEILQHIPARQIKSLTTVSKSWYNVITSSSVLMRNFVFGIRGDWMDCDDFSAILSCSKRKFQKILISDTNLYINDIYNKILMAPNSYITEVKIYDIALETSGDFEKIVRSFEEGVKSLTFSNIKIIHPVVNPIMFNMKRLEHLSVTSCDKEILISLVQSAERLTDLELRQSPHYNENIIMHIKNLRYLKNLDIKGEWFMAIFTSEDISDVKFQLESFTVSYIDFVLPGKAISKLLEFLENQYSLKKVNLSEWFGLDILKCMLKMKTLTEISFFMSPFFRWAIQSLPQNSTIEILDVRTLDVTDEFFNILILLTAMPNLRTIRLRYLNAALAYFIQFNLKKLTKISLVHSDVSDEIKSILPNVEFV